jgi:hypothetical protein
MLALKFCNKSDDIIVQVCYRFWAENQNLASISHNFHGYSKDSTYRYISKSFKGLILWYFAGLWIRIDFNPDPDLAFWLNQDSDPNPEIND